MTAQVMPWGDRELSVFDPNKRVMVRPATIGA